MFDGVTEREAGFGFDGHAAPGGLCALPSHEFNHVPVDLDSLRPLDLAMCRIIGYRPVNRPLDLFRGLRPVIDGSGSLASTGSIRGWRDCCSRSLIPFIC
jgi:hypothetical protein